MDFDNLLEFDDLGDEAALGTVEAGFDWQAGDNFVLGIFGDFTFTDFDARGGDFLCPEGDDDDCIGKKIGVETDNMWTIGGRIGWLSSESTLWYGLAGYTNARVNVSGDVVANEEDILYKFGFLDEKDHVDGFTVGAGVESMLTDNVSLKLEYRYTSLDGFKKLFDPGCEDGCEHRVRERWRPRCRGRLLQGEFRHHRPDHTGGALLAVQLALTRPAHRQYGRAAAGGRPSFLPPPIRPGRWTAGATRRA